MGQMTIGKMDKRGKHEQTKGEVVDLRNIKKGEMKRVYQKKKKMESEERGNGEREKDEREDYGQKKKRRTGKKGKRG